MTFATFCKGSVITASPDQDVRGAALWMCDKKIGAVVIIEQENRIGIPTDRDIVFRVITNGSKPFDTKVRDAMTKNPCIVHEGIGIWELIRMMKKQALRRFLIVSGERKVVGMIKMDNLIELMGTELSGLGNTLPRELSYGDSMAA